MDIEEVDAFLAEQKTLLGRFREWRDGSRPGEYENTWAIADSLGIVRGQLRFRLSAVSKAYPSVSMVCRGNLIWRVDLVPPDECKFNMLGADRLGLPPLVCGSHSHGWPDNRAYVHANGFGHLPYRRPLQAQVRKIEQVVLWLAGEVNLALSPEQRGFDVPPQSSLFEGR